MSLSKRLDELLGQTAPVSKEPPAEAAPAVKAAPPDDLRAADRIKNELNEINLKLSKGRSTPRKN